MCGICGIVSEVGQNKISSEELIRMRDTMVHRGPDDAGMFISQDQKIGLGHRRLAIIDLSKNGHQPMCNEDESVWLTYNGEVYNYQEIRNELIRFGHKFKSNTDTEVIIHGYEEWGISVIEKLKGFFAFGLWDDNEKILFLVRDRLGIKPLYFYHDNHIFAFASEIKALLELSDITREVDFHSLYHYLTFLAVPEPGTLFKGINKIKAGHYLKIKQGNPVEEFAYWDPVNYHPHEIHESEEYYTENIINLLKQSVERRMVSDVPFGVFLSGGVDSATIVALMSQLMDRPVDTFSVAIEGDADFNEFLFARYVAKHYRTNHHEIVIGEKEFLTFLPQMSYYQDEPLADPVCVPLHYVSKLSRDSKTIVVQVGEGSDEIFCGYPVMTTFQKVNHFIYSPLSAMPEILKNLSYRTGGRLFSPEKADILRRLAAHEPLYLGNAIAFWDTEKGQLLNNKYKALYAGQTSGLLVKEKWLDRIHSKGKHFDYYDLMIQLELKNRLPELLLMRVDKISMANSIETRVPFLDHDLVEFALSIPSGMKYKNRVNKYILKKAIEPLLPKEVINRKKIGFCGSATTILSEKIKAFAVREISNSTFINEWFDKEYIDGLVKRHEHSPRFNSQKIWSLMNLALWHKQWFEKC